MHKDIAETRAASRNLPPFCFVDNTDGRVDPLQSSKVLIVRRGIQGYEIPRPMPEEAAEFLNQQIGVSPAQAAAMLAGSMFGWDTPAADPSHYDESGKPK